MTVRKCGSISFNSTNFCVYTGVAIGFGESEYLVQEDVGVVELSVGVLSGFLSPDVSITTDVVFSNGTASCEYCST